jgi:hypothetical protein
VNKNQRVERLEATHNAGAGYETPIALDVYFKRLENERRKQVGEPLIPLTPEEANWQRKTDKDLRAYLARISKQREE